MITSIGVGSKSFQWDHRNRLIQSTVNTSSGIMTVNYAYDPFNRLVKRSDVFNTTYFGYDEGINPQLQMETQSGNQITHRYLWSDQVDELFADEQRLSGLVPDTKWALSDHQLTIKDIADFNSSTGQTTVRHRAYDSFGNRKGSALTTDIVFGYTGKYFDETTGLQNSWNRWYSPKMGRFISQDPIGFGGGDSNLYRYVGNSSPNGTDPSGLQTIPEIENRLIAIYNQSTHTPDDFNLARSLLEERQRLLAIVRLNRETQDRMPSMRSMTPDEIRASQWKELSEMQRVIQRGSLAVRDHERLRHEAWKLHSRLDPYGSMVSDLNQIGWTSLSLAAVGPGQIAKIGGATSPKITSTRSTVPPVRARNLNEGQFELVVVKNGKVIASSHDGLSHRELIKRKLGGVLPEGASVGTVGKLDGKIVVVPSTNFPNNRPTPVDIDSISTQYE
jgi:RHS repeat-associated protein